MKQQILNIIEFIKRINILYRIGILGVLLFILFTEFLSDLKFNLEVKNPKKFTVNQLKTKNPDTLSKYIVLTDAQLMQVTYVDSSEIDDTASYYETYNYVIQQKIKRGDTSMSYITYPIYSLTQLNENPEATSMDLESHVVVEDSRVTEKELENDEYFRDSKFSVMGQCDGKKIDDETHKLLTESGYKISKEAIVLRRGNTPMTLANSIIFSILASLLAILMSLTLIPENVLHRFLGIEPEFSKIVE
jgi:hypothetical protein